MPAFAVLEPPGYRDAAIEDADRFVFLHERFNFWAFLLGPLWMMWQRLWLELVAYVVGLIVIGGGLYALGVGVPAIVVVVGLIQLLLGLEAATLVHWMRVRRGWRDGGVVIADDLDLAERRFFDSRMAHLSAGKGGPMTTPGFTAPGFTALGFAGSGLVALGASPPAGPAGSSGGDVIGLFPEPGGGR
jgi:Protein of unknown function (DUF2628)